MPENVAYMYREAARSIDPVAVGGTGIHLEEEGLEEFGRSPQFGSCRKTQTIKRTFP